MKNKYLNTYKVIFVLLLPFVSFSQDKLSVIFGNEHKSFLVDDSDVIEKNQQLASDEFLVKFDSLTNKEYEIGLPFTIIDDFIQGLKSPHEDNRWIYASRQSRKVPTDLYFYNRQSKDQKLVIPYDRTPEPSLSFVPFAYSSNPDIIFAEAEDYIKGRYHLGIYKVNLLTKEFEKLNIPSTYMSTPLINRSRDKLYFTATTDAKRNFIHGINDLLYSYDLLDNSTTVVKDNRRQSLNFEGFTMRQTKAIPLPAIIPFCQAAWKPPPEHFETVPYVQFRIPFGEGHDFCTGRLGNIPPCDNSQGFAKCQSGTECDHGFDVVGGGCVPRKTLTDVYIAIDLTSPNNEADGRPIYPAANGKVSHIDNDPNGYGNYVEVEHPNGLFTVYAHLDDVYVTHLGQDVCTSIPIGKEGSTGRVTGRHLHFEVRVAHLCRGSEYVNFIDAKNSVLNYGDSGTAKSKRGCGPVPVFLSFQDFEPNCAGVQLSFSGNNITVKDLVVSNLGDNDGEPFKIKYFVVDGTVEYYLGYQQISGLLAFNAALMPDVIFNASNIPLGDYQLKVRIEANSLLNSPDPGSVEADLSNNDCTTYDYVTIGNSASCSDNIQNQGEIGVDCGGPCPICSPLINLSSSACLTPIVNGENLTLLYELANFGSQSSGGFNVSFYAYKSGFSSPHYLNIDQSHGSIPGNTSQTFSKTVNLYSVMSEAGLSEGDYKIGFLIDDYLQVNESNEDDNFCVNDSYFNYSTINLVNAGYCATMQVVGEELHVYHDIINQGSQSTGIVNYQIFVYSDVAAQYYPIGSTYSVLSVSANGSVALVAGFNLETEMSAHGLSPGEYRIAVDIDNAGFVSESNENDNLCLSTTSFSYNGGCNVSDGYIEGYYSGSFDFSAPNFLTSPNAGNQCIIPAGSTLEISGGNYVDMQPGFVAEKGSVFTAVVENCLSITDFVEENEPQQLLQEPIEKEKVEKSDIVVEQIKEEIKLTSHFSVSPNPLKNFATIEYSLHTPALVKIDLYDLNGKKVQNILSPDYQTIGAHQVDLFREMLQNGMYILKLSKDEIYESQKLFIVD